GGMVGLDLAAAVGGDRNGNGGHDLRNRCDDSDLDLDGRVGELRLDTGARWTNVGHPGIPHRVHGIAVIDIRQPDGGAEDVVLVGTGFLEESSVFSRTRFVWV